MKNKYIFLLFSLLMYITSSSQDSNYAISDSHNNITKGFKLGDFQLPNTITQPPATETWVFVNSHSDDFNYTGKGSEFSSKWNDTYFNGWIGPGLTEWNSSNSDVADGHLIISASRKAGTEKVNCGVVTSKEMIKYPIYTEVRAKIANQVLSSNFWFLSPDDEREIDVVEAYGGDRPDQTWFGARAATNTHVFLRNPDTNAIIEDINSQKKHTLANDEPWRNDWHLYGAYWKDPFTIDYYYDGNLVSSVRKTDINDPENLGLDRDSYMIMDLEDHAWRSFNKDESKRVRATDEELADETKNKFLIDYVRTYKPSAPFDSGLIKNGSFNQPTLDNWYWKGDVSISTSFDKNNGEVYVVKLEDEAAIVQKVTVLKHTDYKLSWNSKINTGSTTIEIAGIETKINSNSTWKGDALAFNSGESSSIYVKFSANQNTNVNLDTIKLEKL